MKRKSDWTRGPTRTSMRLPSSSSPSDVPAITPMSASKYHCCEISAQFFSASFRCQWCFGLALVHSAISLWSRFCHFANMYVVCFSALKLGLIANILHSAVVRRANLETENGWRSTLPGSVLWMISQALPYIASSLTHARALKRMKMLPFDFYMSVLRFQGHGMQQIVYDFTLNPTMLRTAKATSSATSTTMGIFYSPIAADHFLVQVTKCSWVQQFPDTIFKTLGLARITSKGHTWIISAEGELWTGWYVVCARLLIPFYLLNIILQGCLEVIGSESLAPGTSIHQNATLTQDAWHDFSQSILGRTGTFIDSAIWHLAFAWPVFEDLDALKALVPVNVFECREHWLVP